MYVGMCLTLMSAVILNIRQTGLLRPFTNDKPFIITFIDDAPKAQECRICKTGFIRRTKIIPFDIVLGHEERWMYPDQKDRTKWVPSGTTTTKYYCVRKSAKCKDFLTSMYPF